MSKLILGSIDISPLLKARNFFSRILEEAENDYEKTGAIKGFWVLLWIKLKNLKKVWAKILVMNPSANWSISMPSSLITQSQCKS